MRLELLSQMSITTLSTAEFAKLFRAAPAETRPSLLEKLLIPNRDSLRCIVTAATARTLDLDAFAAGLLATLKHDETNLPALRLLAWHQIRQGEFESAKGTLAQIIKHWPQVTDVRGEALRAEILTPSAAGTSIFQTALSELRTPLARASYACQWALSKADDESLANTGDALRLQVDQVAAQIFRASAATEELIPEKSKFVFFEAMRRLLAADTIALVGNGPSLRDSGLGSVIDDHDVVIRCNFPALYHFGKDVGTRTDLMFFNETLFNKLEQFVAREAPYKDCPALSFYPEDTIIFPKEIFVDNSSDRISRIPEGLRRLYRRFCYTRSTTGLMGIILIAVVLEKNVDLFGFDFYDSDVAHYYPSNSPIFLGHEVQYERWFVEKFLNWLHPGKVRQGVAKPAESTEEAQPPAKPAA